MISPWFFAKSSYPPLLPIILLVTISLFTTNNRCNASPAGIEAILDPLGDLVQVAPSLALHQEEAEKAQQSAAEAAASVKSIKTPSGTVKCSCQTVVAEGEGGDGENPDDDAFPNDPTKTIEIEIYKQTEGKDEVDYYQDADEKEDRKDEAEGESEVVETSEKKPPLLVRNSFMLDDEEGVEASSLPSASPFAPSADRLFSTEEPFSFLSYLSSLVSSSVQAPAEQEAQFLRASEPETAAASATEAKQESDKVAGLLNSDINVANHRMFDTGATATTPAYLTTTKTVYKAFQSADLIGVAPTFPTMSDGSNHQKMDSVEGNQQQDDFFLWDFIYANHGGNKQKQRLTLGTVMDPFKGPRRRRRRRALRGNNSPVYYVYPVGQGPKTQETKENNEVVIPPENQTKTEALNNNQKIQVRSSAANGAVEMDKDELHRAMQDAMDRAWSQYGPKGLDAPPATPAPPSPVVIIPASEQPPPPKLTLPRNRLQQQQAQFQARPVPYQLSKNSQQQQQKYVFYSPPRPFLFIDRIFNPFQPMESEWDKNVVVTGPPPPPPEPGFFSRFMASYIDFEVNNHEAADLMRKVVFGIFVGFLLAGWLALGAALGIVPFKKLLAWFVGTHYDDKLAAKRIDKGKEFLKRDTTISDLTDKILLSLDADWLKRLEERVMGTEVGDIRNGVSKIPTQVFCCILPDEQTSGMVECQVTKGYHHQTSDKKKKTTAFKCITDLIYNFHFGPPDVEEDTEIEQNTVKSKANNNNNDDEENQQSESENVKR